MKNFPTQAFIGGELTDAASGATFDSLAPGSGELLAKVAACDAEDVDRAVGAARKAFGSWSSRTAYNRAQIVYRIAEVMEDRRPQFVQAVVQSEGLTASKAEKVVDAAIDRLVWYAGWADKITQVVGNANPVAGPYFNLSTPEPSGVIAVVAPRDALLGLVSVVAPLIITGNTVVVIASEENPLTAITLGEVMATSDLPGGVVNVLTGSAAEIAPWLASHMDVNGIDLTGIEDAALATELEVAAADNLKRVRRPAPDTDWLAEPGLDRMTQFLETKTVWHPIGV